MMDLSVDSFVADEVRGLDGIHKAWEDIPILDDVANHDIVDGTLYRFRGMIQDMPNPVFYFSQYAVQNASSGVISVRSGKYRSSLVCSEGEKLLLDDGSSVSSERRPYYCVSVPALNSWAKLKSKTQIRPMEQVTSTVKRPLDSMDVDDVPQEVDANKRLCTERTSNPSSGASVTNLQCPIPSSHDVACVVHIYNADDSYKVNDIVDVVGFVYASGTDQDDVDVPPSLAPRLHAVTVRTNPIMTTLVTDLNPSSIRSDLHLALTQLCLGDHLAADYLICHLLSNVYSRRDVVLGKFSLNLSNVPLDPLYSSGLYDVLSSLVPKSHYFPMSLENMNSSDLVPVKNYDTNRLHTGLLQLSERTHLVVDETKLKTGKLLERGVKNVQVFNTLLSDQSVNYDFKFYNVPFPMNIPVLVLSEGKSLLRCDTVVKLTTDGSFVVAETLEAVKSYLKEPLLSCVRQYLATVATKEFTIPADLSEAIQNDFVAMRREDAKITPDEMHSHLGFARLLALSLGQESLTKEIWDRASELERLRRVRL